MRNQRFFGMLLLLGSVGTSTYLARDYAYATEVTPPTLTDESWQVEGGAVPGNAWQGHYVHSADEQACAYWALWDDYCCQKQIGQEYDVRVPQNVLRPAPFCRPSEAAQRVSRALRCALCRTRVACRQRRVACFHRFCNLLGWNACRCSASSSSIETDACCDQRLPEHESSREDGGADPALWADEPPVPPKHLLPLEESAVAGPQSDASSDVLPEDVMGEEAPDTEAPGEDTPAPSTQEPVHAVPRNELPKNSPASSRRPRSGGKKVFLVERLSDYIRL